LSAKLTQNISYLSLSQVANYIFPLITIPYITRVLGPENYALVEFAAVIMLYLTAIVDYGFLNSATRQIAQDPHNPKHLSKVLSAVMQARLLLFGAAFSTFTLLLLFIPEFSKNYLILILSAPIVLGMAIYPSFLFFGQQKAGVIALTNVLVKGLSTALIFILINDQSDFLWVNLLNGFSQIGISLVTIVYAFKSIPNLKLLAWDWTLIKFELKASFYLFISNFSTRIYGFLSIPMGLFLLNPLQLGVFAAAAKLINVAQSVLFQPLHGALFPHLSQAFAKSFADYREKHKKSLILLSIATGLASLFLMLMAEFIIRILFSEAYIEAAPLLRVMAPMLAVGAFAHMFLQQGLIILKEDKAYMWVLISVGLSSILLNYFLISNFGLNGAAYARLSSEVLLTLLASFVFYYKLHFNAASKRNNDR
jgi:PST family polysaccharide transporter